MILYLKAVWMYIKCELEYRASFLLSFISTAFSSLFAIMGTLILISKFGIVGEWTISEIIFTTGLAYFGHSVTEMFGRGFDHFYKQVKDGLLDRILTRPRSISLQVMCSDFQLTKIGRIIESIILLIYGILTLDITWNYSKAIVVLFMIFGTLIIFSSILLLKASFSFWTVEGMEFMNIISDGGRDLSCYPINIYQKWFANIFTYIIPFGLVNYYPLVYLMADGGVSTWYGLTPLLTLIFMGVSICIWKLGVKQYKSTGS